ncbi:MAG: ribosome assembly RNA-binding protein YhbY [Clostridia bacterium]|nr:ribosome assembly RNA-binding protein YhbY [Clostridia bacterium]
MLTSKQRAQLKGLANGLDAIFQIGKGGINAQLLRQVDETLECRELIKLRVLETSPGSVRETAEQVAEQTGSQVVQVIGSKFILYRESKDNKQIRLVK